MTKWVKAGCCIIIIIIIIDQNGNNHMQRKAREDEKTFKWTFEASEWVKGLSLLDYKWVGRAVCLPSVDWHFSILAVFTFFLLFEEVSLSGNLMVTL